MRETKVDTSKIKSIVIEKLKAWYTHDFKTYGFKKKDWPDYLKAAYRNEYSNVYNQLRKERKQKKADFWITMAGKGNMQMILNELGLRIRSNNHVSFKDMAREILKAYLETVVIPKLEQTFNLTGIKVGKDTSPMCYNVLDFENAEIKNDDPRE